MARPKVYSIRLTDDERSKLNKVIKSKNTCKTVLKHCQILRDLDETISPNSAAAVTFVTP